MSDEDPWKGLAVPQTLDAVSARRVDSRLPWGFFWARSIRGHLLLVLRHDPKAAPIDRLPHLRGLEMYEAEGEDHGLRTLVLQLEDAAHREIFHRLCLDIVAAAGQAKTEEEAVRMFLARTWSWHHLLRGGGEGRLGTEEQKGLIGELIVLEQLVLPRKVLTEPVTSWRGPLGAPKDFEIGRLAIEAKARRGAATPYIAISSEHQLDTSGVDALFVHVAELSQEQAHVRTSLTLTDFVRRARAAVAVQDIGGVERFESLLAAAGFRWEDDYSDVHWGEGPHHLFQVRDGFPAITPDICPSGVRKVRYSVTLAECEPFRVTPEFVVSEIEGAGHAD